MRRRFAGNTLERSETAGLEGVIAERALPLAEAHDLDPLLSRIAGVRYVLLGEASHGTSEFYTWRMEISKRLILERGFSFVAVEGDWPDCHLVNRYVRGEEDADSDARAAALRYFERWPTWMWANEEMIEFVEWLKHHNAKRPAAERVGFYGLDVYSLWDSLYQIMGYVQRARSELLPAARRAFTCLEPYGEDVQDYAAATQWLDQSCENEVVSLLTGLLSGASRVPSPERESQFNAEQNAWVVANAERYYRTMVRGGPDSWNVRDQHMTETLERLMQHCGPRAKAIVWEHNTHIGDARAQTDMAEAGMVNVGQLVRDAHETDDVVLVGFGTHRGSVIAGSAWEAPMQPMRVPAAEPGSWEDVLHRVGPLDKLLIFGEDDRRGPAARRRGHRAIGVVYHPDMKAGTMFPPTCPDGTTHFCFSIKHALRPLRGIEVEEMGEVPETFPSGV